MVILLKKLILNNFKGVKSLEINFSKKTSVYGANATGKTTIFDAFTWLLFNKDSQGNTAFGIKTFDENNNVINHLEHSVEGVFDIDGNETLIKKVHTQKWVKKKGCSTPALEGTVNRFYWNDVPQKEKEYQEKIKNLIEPDLFYLITSPSKFNSLNWKDMRNILFQMAGNISDADVISGNRELEPLLNVLNNKSFDEYKKEISAKKNKLKKDMESINPRIDEVHKSIIDVGQIVDINPIKQRLTEVDVALYDNQKAYNEHEKKQWEVKNKINNLRQQMDDIKAAGQRKSKQLESERLYKISGIERQIKDVNDNSNNISDNIKRYHEYLTTENETLRLLRTQAINKKTESFSFDEDSCICPTCKRKLDLIDIENQKESLHANFNNNKAKAIEEITALGIKAKERIFKIEENIKQSETDLDSFRQIINELHKELELLKSTPIPIEEISVSNIEIEITELEKQLTPYSDKEAETQKDLLTAEKQQLQNELTKAQEQAMILEANRKANERIKELEQEEKNIAEIIAQLEGQEFLLEEFTRSKINMTENKINDLFKLAKFKMFHTHVNGSITECCEATYLGVPYSDLNAASRINVGLDIINALTRFYGVVAPIFIDNRESVIEIVETQSQIINLIVSENDKSLRITEDIFI